ncbi:hypothetical protein EOM82_01750 [bacterium]|nr:hypothetical protein [bacterium]
MQLFIKQKFISIGDKYNVTDANENTVFTVKSRVISPLLHKKYLLDASGRRLMTIQRKIVDILPNYIIKDESGNKIARIKRRFSLRSNFMIIGYNKDFSIKGDFFAWNYSLYQGNEQVGSIAKKIIHLSDKYTLDIRYPEDAPFFTACVIAIDNLCHNGFRSGNR